MTAPMTASPQEMANRQLVQNMAMQGSVAKQAPPIGTAPEAMQTAMARSAGINAPANFNATQAPTIQNPFTRADAQLAADNSGAGGVMGAINSSTADYMQQAQGALPLQQEITRRAVQQLAQQHEFDSQKLALDKLNIETQMAEARLKNDPNSPQYKLAQLTAQNDYKKATQEAADLALPQSPTSVADTSKMTGLTPAAINSFQSLPNYTTWAGTAKQMGKDGFTADQWASQAYLIAQQQKDLGGDANPIKTNADVSALAHSLTATFGPMFHGFSLASAGGPSAPGPQVPGMPGLTAPLPGGGTPGTMAGYNAALAAANAPPAAPTNPAAMMWGQAMQRGVTPPQQYAPPAYVPPVVAPSPEGGIPLSPEIAAMSDLAAKNVAPVTMSDADAKKLAAELAKGSKKKGKK